MILQIWERLSDLYLISKIINLYYKITELFYGNLYLFLMCNILWIETLVMFYVYEAAVNCENPNSMLSRFILFQGFQYTSLSIPVFCPTFRDVLG